MTSLPRRLELFIDELPEATQAWLADEAIKAHLFQMKRRGRFSDVVLALVFTAVWAAVACQSLLDESGWPGWLALLYAAAAFAATAPLLWVWREVAWGFSVPHRRMVCLHPRWLLEVGVEKLVAWPSVHLVRGNDLTLGYGKKRLTVPQPALEQMQWGPAEHDDFVPLRFYEPGFRSKVGPMRRAAAARRFTYAVVIAAALGVAAGLTGDARQRERVWASAVNTGSTSELAKVLEQRPEEAGSDRLDVFRKAQLSAARRSLEATLEQTDPRLLALEALLLSVQKANHPRLSLRTRPLPLPLQGSTGAQASAFSDREIEQALRRFPQRLYDGFAQAMTRPAREVLAVTSGSAERGVTVEVTLTPRLLEKSVQVGRTRWPLLGLSAVAVLEGQQLSTASAELDESDCAMLASADVAGEVLDAQMQRLLWKMGGALAHSFGLAVEP